LSGEKLNFRRKLSLVFSATVLVVVVAVAWTVSTFTRSAFDRINEERTLALVRQFQREFNRRGDEVVQQVEAIAAGDAAARMVLELRRAQPDYGAYVGEAKAIADSHRLDFLEFVDSQGKIISSAQWPAKFGYKDSSLNLAVASKRAYLKEEDLPQGSALGLVAVRPVSGGDAALYVAGGRRLDRDFLGTLDLPAGMRALLYQNVAPGFSAQLLIDPSGREQETEKIAPLIQEVLQDGNEHTGTIHWSPNQADDETMHTIALPGQGGRIAGVLLVGSSRRPYVELSHRLRDVALLVGGAGVLLALFISNWAAWLVTRPVEQLAAAARSIAAGDRGVSVKVSSHDELGELADAFNRMTRELSEQSELLVQAERVAAWRELARRLAHELKNPLFPLQLTVENLVRAHAHSPQMFEEMFRESTATLLAEIANLKSTIGRFSEFSKMPQPTFQQVDVNDLVQQVVRVFQAQLQSQANTECRLELEKNLPLIAGDADLLHRAISNLVLNAMDAVANGGTITLATKKRDSRVRVEVRDTGSGLTPEECERLFTPYYTTKQHGTGLGLAIVQSIVSDHQGTVSVQSAPERGTIFTIELPRNWDRLASGQTESAKSTVKY
jgi:signal transduction histidine kinase